MSIDSNQTFPTPPRLVQSLLAGFDSVSNHFTLILFPLVMDLLLWFGPRLSILTLTKDFFSRLAGLPGFDTTEGSQILELNQELMTLTVERLNLFSFLRTYPVGIPSLMVSIQPVQTPQGIQLTLQLHSILYVLILLVLLGFLGLIAGTVYFWAVSRATLDGSINWQVAIKECSWAMSQVFLLSLFWIAILLVASIPASCLVSIFSFGGFNVGRVGVFITGGLMIWLIFPILFSSHGIFVHRKNMWSSIQASVRITRFTFPNTAILFLTVLVTSEGLAILWRTPGETSWLTLVGIAGHGFIATGLLAATIIYYRDASLWVDRLMQQLKLESKA